MRRRLTFIAAAALASLMLGAPLAAQAPARLLGRVTDASTQAPVAQAEVRVGDLRAATGPDGGFLLGSVPPGRLRLEVRRIGYTPSSAVVEILPGLDRSIAVSLVPVALELDSITVLAGRGGISIGGDELARRGHDLAQALDGWEGVAVRRTGSAGPAAPQLRGGGPDEVLVLVDGFALNDPLSGRADLRSIPSAEVEKVTLLPGAQTVRAGSRAIAGVLSVETRRPLRPEGSSWAGSHGALGLRLGASAGPLAVSASSERYASGFGYTVPEVRGGGQAERRNAGGTQSTVFARLEGPVELSLRGSQSERGLPGTTTNPTLLAHAEDRSVLLGVRREGRLHSSASLQWIETRAADPAPVAGPAYDSYTHGIGGTAELGLRAGIGLGAWSGEAGAAVEARGDRFGGDGVRDGASFTHAALRLDAALHRGRTSVVTIAPAVRLDLWTGHARPVASARLDLGLQRGRTAFTASVGSAVTPPVLADLFFREGVGVQLNPDLRPERVRWEVEAGVRREFGPAGGLGALSLRGFAGRVGDMVVWAPDFRFVWSPRNFDVRRRGGEVSLTLNPLHGLRLDGSATFAAVTYDHPGGAQVQYRPRVTYAAGAAWSRGAWGADVRWHRIGARFPNSAGTNVRPAISLTDLGLERQLGASLLLRAEVRDLTDARAEFIAGYPTPGRTFTATLTFQLP
ncbi:MAG TPA: TonB-dependent receptor plug domain-containing protein [Gemmatimonadales bacterium]|nr:TonB-dependent receptor plug domain-containing protein [Gemmatimonadales bacterium]